jgi:hypothetical protein
MVQWAREEEEWMRCKEWEEDAKSRERRGGDVDGEPHAWHQWEELARGEGWQGITVAVVIMATTRAAARTRSSWISPTCNRKRQERIEMMLMRGEDDLL